MSNMQSSVGRGTCAAINLGSMQNSLIGDICSPFLELPPSLLDWPVKNEMNLGKSG